MACGNSECHSVYACVYYRVYVFKDMLIRAEFCGYLRMFQTEYSSIVFKSIFCKHTVTAVFQSGSFHFPFTS
jgi:hypothetical protein